MKPVPPSITKPFGTLRHSHEGHYQIHFGPFASPHPAARRRECRDPVFTLPFLRQLDAPYGYWNRLLQHPRLDGFTPWRQRTERQILDEIARLATQDFIQFYRLPRPHDALIYDERNRAYRILPGPDPLPHILPEPEPCPDPAAAQQMMAQLEGGPGYWRKVLREAGLLPENGMEGALHGQRDLAAAHLASGRLRIYRIPNAPPRPGKMPLKVEYVDALGPGNRMNTLGPHDGQATENNVYPKTLSTQKEQAVMQQLDSTFARSDEIIRKAIETGRIPDVSQNRIILREGAAGLPKKYNGNGLNYAFGNHANPAKAAKKSQFTISDQEVIKILQDNNVIANQVSIVNQSSKKVGGLSLVRQVDLSQYGYGNIGKLPQNPAFNGASTAKITIITDGFGNLKNMFPGYLDDLN